MKALIIVDMLKDFLDGKLANPKAQAIVSPLQKLLAHARRQGWAIVFSDDAHHPGDPELKVWGPHAMAGDLHDADRFFRRRIDEARQS